MCACGGGATSGLSKRKQTPKRDHPPKRCRYVRRMKLRDASTPQICMMCGTLPAALDKTQREERNSDFGIIQSPNRASRAALRLVLFAQTYLLSTRYSPVISTSLHQVFVSDRGVFVHYYINSSSCTTVEVTIGTRLACNPPLYAMLRSARGLPFQNQKWPVLARPCVHTGRPPSPPPARRRGRAPPTFSCPPTE